MGKLNITAVVQQRFTTGYVVPGPDSQRHKHANLAKWVRVFGFWKLAFILTVTSSVSQLVSHFLTGKLDQKY